MERWKKYKETSILVKSISTVKRKYETSESPVIEYTRSLTESFHETICTAALIPFILPRFNPE
jgi:hypothetical protein